MYDFLDELKLDIESTWTNYQAAQEQYSHYSKAVEYSKYTRSAYVEQFQIGRRSILDVLDTRMSFSTPPPRPIRSRQYHGGRVSPEQRHSGNPA